MGGEETGRGARGQTLVEYALVIALISVLSVTLLSVVGFDLQETFNRVHAAIGVGLADEVAAPGDDDVVVGGDSGGDDSDEAPPGGGNGGGNHGEGQGNGGGDGSNSGGNGNPGGNGNGNPGGNGNGNPGGKAMATRTPEDRFL